MREFWVAAVKVRSLPVNGDGQSAVCCVLKVVATSAVQVQLLIGFIDRASAVYVVFGLRLVKVAE